MASYSLSRITGTLLCLALLAALPGCSGDKKDGAAGQLPPPLVGVMTIEPEDVPLQSIYMGQTQGYLSAQVSAQVGGILKSRTYKEGDYVKQGQILFEIDPAPYQAALDQAKGQLTMAQTQYDNAKREYDRIIPLYARNAVSQRDRDSAQAGYDAARAQVASARAAVEQAQIQLNYTKVAAPISGYTSLESVTEGNLISPGTPLTSINQTDPMYVSFAIPSGEMRMLRQLTSSGRASFLGEGATATMSLLEGDRYPHTGKVTFVDTKIDPFTSSIHARALFPNPDQALLPGQYASVSINSVTLNKAMMIPQNAVLQTANGPMVYVLDANNVVNLRPVRLGQIFGSEFLLDSGLEPGSTIVVEGIIKARPGSAVTPKPVERPRRVNPLTTPDSVPPTPSTQIGEPAPVLSDDLKGSSNPAAQN